MRHYLSAALNSRMLPAVRGEAAVTLGVGEEREVERIPAQLRRFL